MDNARCIFFFNDTATTEIYTLSLHDALPILRNCLHSAAPDRRVAGARVPLYGIGRRRGYVAWPRLSRMRPPPGKRRSEEHTSELQSRQYLVCRLLLEKKKQNAAIPPASPTRW